MNYTQFRLSNGDEIIAQVIEEPQEDEINIVVRNAMMIIRTESMTDGYRYYSFRPWMSFQLNDQYFQLLNYSHIVGEAKPDKVLLDQYNKALESEASHSSNADMSDSDHIANVKRMIYEMKKDVMHHSDSDSKNVIRLFNKDKMH